MFSFACLIYCLLEWKSYPFAVNEPKREIKKILESKRAVISKEDSITGVDKGENEIWMKVVKHIWKNYKNINLEDLNTKIEEIIQ